jgi:hypothetical protein
LQHNCSTALLRLEIPPDDVCICNPIAAQRCHA